MTTTLKQAWEHEQQQQQQIQLVTNSSNNNMSYSGGQIEDTTTTTTTTNNNINKDEETSIVALNVFRAREEEIEKKKLEVREKVTAQLGRVEEEVKRLAGIRHELESLSDPKRKEVTTVRKKIDTLNKELKPLEKLYQKKEKEYKDALESFNQKNKEKSGLVSRLMELVGESERVRMKRLEELGKNIDSLC
ncbi:hypothetical protein C5167_000998 [Papaver somniferum]|uniref:RAB6-interacting golgin n=1 Tax=Papaver somniferum TaxID=3469 RepID=A0A4Y7KWX8_PAPSO|nr:uncharacterized protein LOC113309779 [Papaver somniferum]RZC76870.1 hypothetical protein C5167_000998 [Papaver somniferum]